MTEGKIEIFLSYKEPEYKGNILWLRPYLDREGYELLYYGTKGWTPLLCGGCPYKKFPALPEDNPDTDGHGNNHSNDNDKENKTEDKFTEIPDGHVEEDEGNLWEVPSPFHDSSEPSKSPCGCPDINN